MKLFPADTPQPFRPLLALLTVTAAITSFVGARIAAQGQWLPPVPNTIDDIWTAVDMPIDQSTLAQLGFPNSLGRKYSNLYNENVGVNVIAAASIDAFHEPIICMAGYGYTLTAQKYLPLFGPDNRVRALVLKSDSGDQRILLYYWVQDQQGNTSTKSSFRDYQDYGYRMNHGLNAALSGRQSCIVRVYTTINPTDPDGRQARRDVDEVALGIYRALRSGAGQEGK